MHRLRINPMRSALLTLLALAAVALLGCVQAEAIRKPPLSKVPEPVLMATATPNLPATPTPTPFPAAPSNPSLLNPELLLPRINSAMAGVRSFHAEGSWIVGEPGRSEAVAVVTQFAATVELQGDSRLVLTGRPKDSSLANRHPFEMRQVDGITYVQELRDGSWSVEEEGKGSFLQQATFKAALSGGLALEDMRLEQVVSADWRQVYRITGSAPHDPEADQVVILVHPEEMLILELQLKGHVSSSEFGYSQHQPHYLDVRFSKFNEPVEIPIPQLVPAPAPVVTPTPLTTPTPTAAAISTPTPTPTSTPVPKPMSREEVVLAVGYGQNLYGRDLSGADLSNLSLGGARLSNTNLTGADLSGANLRSVDLHRANLEGANLTGASLQSANLWGALLPQVDLSGLDLSNANLREAQLNGANLFHSVLEYASLVQTNLTGARLNEAMLEEADLTDAILRGADLRAANLSRASLKGAKLNGANLAGADLTGANLAGADLTGANLAGADLTDANLTGADLTDANFSKANLTDADLSNAWVAGTIFYNTTLEGTNFASSKWWYALCQRGQECTKIMLDARDALLDDLHDQH